MTVTSNISTAGPYAGDGVTTAFVVGFPFLDATYLEVTTSDGATDTLLTLNTDYKVTGAGQQSGQVILMQPLAVGHTLTIERVVPLTQLADYVQGDAFPAETHEKALDKLTMIAQQLERGLPLPVNLAGLGLAANGRGTLSVKAGSSIEVGVEGVAVSRQFRDTVTAQALGIEGLQNETAMIQLRVNDLAASIGEPNSFGDGFLHDAATKTISVKPHTGIAVSADGVAVSKELLATIDAKPNAGDVIAVTAIATTSDIAAATAGKVVDAAGLVQYMSDRFAIIYPNGGSAASPANITINQRYVMANPFPGHEIDFRIQLRYGGEWGSVSSYNHTSGGVGIVADVVDDVLRIQTGSYSLFGSPAGTLNVFVGASQTTTAPCRIKIWRVD